MNTIWVSQFLLPNTCNVIPILLRTGVIAAELQKALPSYTVSTSEVPSSGTVVRPSMQPLPTKDVPIALSSSPELPRPTYDIIIYIGDNDETVANLLITNASSEVCINHLAFRNDS